MIIRLLPNIDFTMYETPGKLLQNGVTDHFVATSLFLIGAISPELHGITDAELMLMLSVMLT